jgi:hypothetical protein
MEACRGRCSTGAAECEQRDASLRAGTTWGEHRNESLRGAIAIPAAAMPVGLRARGGEPLAGLRSCF